MVKEGSFPKPDIHTEKGGELDFGWKDNPYEAQRRHASEPRSSQAERRTLPRRRKKPVNVNKAKRAEELAMMRGIAADHIARSHMIPEPGIQPSHVPYSGERMNFGPEVRQRRKPR